MNTKERLYVWLNNGTFVEKDGCTHPQDIIAAAIGCTERTVIRCVQQLEAEGRVRVHRPRRRGACNTYYVACWNPAKRAGVLNVLKAVRPSVLERRRERENRQCHIKRTATASRAHTTSQATTPGRCSGRTSAVVARPRCELCGFEIRRSQVPQPRQRRLSAVPDLLCESCRRYAEEVEAKAEIIQKLARENSELADKFMGAVETANATGKENATLKRRITRAANEDAEAEAIEAICEDWRKDHPRASIAPGGRRWEVAKRALRLMKDDEQGAKHACLEALEGLRLRPYQHFEKRYATPGEGRVRRDDIEHALGDEVRIERCRAYARWAALTTPEQWWLFYEAARAVSELYWRRAVDAISEAGESRG